MVLPAKIIMFCIWSLLKFVMIGPLSYLASIQMSYRICMEAAKPIEICYDRFIILPSPHTHVLPNWGFKRKTKSLKFHFNGSILIKIFSFLLVNLLGECFIEYFCCSDYSNNIHSFLKEFIYMKKFYLFSIYYFNYLPPINLYLTECLIPYLVLIFSVWISFLI